MKSEPRVVAIDGSAGSGKSTLARSLARALEMPFVNTGLMYRAVAAAALSETIDLDDEDALGDLARGLTFTITGSDPPELVVDGWDEKDLSTVEVEGSVSQVAAHDSVREALRAAQRTIGEATGAVMEGRDIGSKVFPDAAVKLYVDADPDVRRRRRAKQRDRTDHEGVSVQERDRRDDATTRLAPTAGARRIDTTHLSETETLQEALAIVEERAPGLIPRPPLATPKIAVLGRQNVGKSTLVNRMFGSREAIADSQPGVTRDRVELQTTWNGRRFGLVDTAGFRAKATGVEALAQEQASRAEEEASLCLLVVDAQAGLHDEDAAIARRLRGGTVPALVVANKVDGERDLPDVADFYALGLGEPMPVSALHGRGVGDLLDRVVALLPSAPQADAELAHEPTFAVVGRPNVGKSSLFNRIVGHERSVVFEEAGTTRDAVDAIAHWPSGPVRFVDTAGMRRGGKVTGVEYYSFIRAAEAIARSDVVVLVIDAAQGFAGEDKRIANRVMEAGRALLVVANKWDLVRDRDRLFKQLTKTMTPFAGAPVVRTSALTGRGVDTLPAALVDLDSRWRSRVRTSRVNQVVEQAQRERPTPRGTGTLHYATQVSTGPPTFAVFGGRRIPPPGYRRYLENRLRREFDLQGIPIRVVYRERGSRKTRSPELV
jgi:GTP-binding protein